MIITGIRCTAHVMPWQCLEGKINIANFILFISLFSLFYSILYIILVLYLYFENIYKLTRSLLEFKKRVIFDKIIDKTKKTLPEILFKNKSETSHNIANYYVLSTCYWFCLWNTYLAYLYKQSTQYAYTHTINGNKLMEWWIIRDMGKSITISRNVTKQFVRSA